MARLEFFVVSVSASVDQTTNQASIFDIIEEVKATAFPSLLHSCVAFSLWRREPGDEERDFQLILRITTPGGAIHDFPSNFRMPAARHRTLVRVQGLLVEQPGQLRFEAILNGTHAAEHVVDVQQITPSETVASRSPSA